jgi:hypothetical protein
MPVCTKCGVSKDTVGRPLALAIGGASSPRHSDDQIIGGAGSVSRAMDGSSEEGESVVSDPEQILLDPKKLVVVISHRCYRSAATSRAC